MKPEPKKHAKFSPSAASRWVACPASIPMSEGEPPSPDSPASIEGTKGHEAFEAMLVGGRHKMLSTSAFLKKTYGAEMTTHAEWAASAVWKRAPKGAEILSETPARLDFIDPNFHGTADAVIVEDFERLTVIDYKYGRHPVDAKGNLQLIAYALGVAHRLDFNFEAVRLMILQPRGDGERISEWEISLTALFEYRDIFAKAIRQTRAETPPIKSGPHCRFCPAAHKCPEFRNGGLDAARLAFKGGDLVTPPPVGNALVDLSNLGQVLRGLDQLDAWAARVREFAFFEMKRGASVDGFKLVEKRASRKWADVAKIAVLARDLFGKEAFAPAELLSPAQIELAVGKKRAAPFLKEYAVSISSGLTIAPEDDKRKSVNPMAEAFGDGESEPTDGKARKTNATNESERLR